MICTPTVDGMFLVCFRVEPSLTHLLCLNCGTLMWRDLLSTRVRTFTVQYINLLHIGSPQAQDITL